MVENAPGSALIRYIGWALAPIIPKSVETIGVGRGSKQRRLPWESSKGQTCFMGWKSLASVTFGADSVLREIEEYAFEGVDGQIAHFGGVLRDVISEASSFKSLALVMVKNTYS
jgi:hypothetical protein